MAARKQTPKSIRFDAEAEKQIQELTEVFDETPVRLLHRAVKYLYDNRESAIDAEAERRKSLIQKQKQQK